MTLFNLKQKLKTTEFGKKLYSLIFRVKKLREDKMLLNYKKGEDSKKVEELKNSIPGKRCFIIGNGPSLTIEDLELIKNEDTFASNRIYGVFERVKWRPTYYCIQDHKMILTPDIMKNVETIAKKQFKIFLPYKVKNHLSQSLQQDKNICYVLDAWYQEGMEEISFSLNCAHFIGGSMTVTYMMIQLAVYMGYKEIYLLGVDHNYQLDKSNHATNNSYASFIAETDLRKQWAPHTDLSTLAYIKARKVCEDYHIVIRNATRGGMLEVFERINLEEILK